MLAQARSRIVRYTPEQAAAEPDLVLVDIRSEDERARTGVIPVSEHIVGGYEAW